MMKLAIDSVEVANTPINEPLTEAVEPQPSTETQPLTVSRAALAEILAKTPKEAKTFSATLTTLGGVAMKPASIQKWTKDHDPEGRSWMPTDETREYWAVQLATDI